MKKDQSRYFLLERASLFVLPVVILMIFLFSTEGAPVRFHLLNISSYGFVSVMAIFLSFLRGQFLRPSVLMHLIWLAVYAITAVALKVSVSSIAESSGDSKLSGLLWIVLYFKYAVVAPIAATAVWAVVSRAKNQPSQ